jgi:hypothetical protein
LCFAVLLLTGAALGDRFGRRRMFAAGLAIFVLASAAVRAYRKLVDRRARRPGCRRAVPAVCVVAMNRLVPADIRDAMSRRGRRPTPFTASFGDP